MMCSIIILLTPASEAQRLELTHNVPANEIPYAVSFIALVVLIRFDINQNKDTISAAKESEEIST
jgi:hypothetical protein